jgi:hypothetical protein
MPKASPFSHNSLALGIANCPLDIGTSENTTDTIDKNPESED